MQIVALAGQQARFIARTEMTNANVENPDPLPATVTLTVDRGRPEV
jgi:hypothetical protein